MIQSIEMFENKEKNQIQHHQNVTHFCSLVAKEAYNSGITMFSEFGLSPFIIK